MAVQAVQKRTSGLLASPLVRLVLRTMMKVGRPCSPAHDNHIGDSASNYAHVQAGRAHIGGGYALANGANQNMGLYNTFFTSTLAQTTQGYHIAGNCP